MNGKTTKMLAIVAIIGLCAVALIGAAYAAFAGTASTYNEGNAASAGYMTLTPQATGQAGAWDAIVDDADGIFNTYVYNNSGTKTAYYISGASDNVTITGYNFVKALGTKNFTLQNETGETISAIDINVKAADIDGNTPLAYGSDEFAYFLGIKIGSGTEQFVKIGTSVMEFSNLGVTFTNKQATVTATIYIAYAVDGYIEASYPIGVPAQSGTGLTSAVGVNTSTDAPSGLAASFAFVASEYVAPAQQQGN